jgi:hypothetical protein
MKRYLLFAGEEYYPNGGMNDFVNDFDKESDAVALGNRLLKEKPDWFSWIQVYDCKKRRLVLSNSAPRWSDAILAWKRKKK